MNYLRFSLLASVTLLAFTACDKDPAQTGCTDPFSANYDPSALKDDGSCVYNRDEQTIWNNGAFGGWNGDLLQGAFVLETCEGDVTEIEQLSDTLGNTTLRLSANDNGFHRSYFKTLNDRNARDYGQGSLRMDIQMADTLALPATIKFFINGKLPQNGSCEAFQRSEFVEISTQALSDTAATMVNIPLGRFAQKQLAGLGVICGFEFDDQNGSAIEIDNLRWVATFYE